MSHYQELELVILEGFKDQTLSSFLMRPDSDSEKHRTVDSTGESMSASESDAYMITQDSPYKSAAEERMHEGDEEADEENLEAVEVEVLVKEQSPVARKELVKEVKKFLRSGQTRRYLTGYFKTSGWPFFIRFDIKHEMSRLWRQRTFEDSCEQPVGQPGGGGQQRSRSHNCSS